MCLLFIKSYQAIFLFLFATTGFKDKEKIIIFIHAAFYKKIVSCNLYLKRLEELLLVKECLQGKHESQKRLYEQFAHKMLGVCYRYAHSREEAEDFLQEAFIVVFRKLHQYKGEGALGGWIRKIVINTSLNFIKAQHRFIESDNMISIDSISDNNVLRQPCSDKELMEIVRELPKGYRIVFNLYAIEGYSHDEIGQMIGVKASTSRSQFMRARELLMKRLNSESTVKTNDEQHG